MKKEIIKTTRFEFRTTPLIIEYLTKLSAEKQMSKSELMTYLIRKEYEKEVKP